MDSKVTKLIFEAKRRMKASPDPAHDLTHAEQVASYAKQLAKDTGLNSKDTQALVLAAWWHDVGRTITKKPSIVWMPFVDDMISALMLWKATIKCRLFGSITGKSTRIIFCKSFATGQLLTRILIRKKDRILIDLLKDADSLDILNLDRMEKLMTMADSSKIYHAGYKAAIRWFLTTKHLHMKTQAARNYVIRLMKLFISWLKQKHIFEWHTQKFGLRWVNNMIKKGEIILKRVEKKFHINQLKPT